ncbi:ATP-binding protein [Hymenobacter sp. YC55]|uniref:ATP-binding protein n=1 Tax=Hymenobacter sp. YC55 TaxID=3034019 RepID=UPI0023F7A109|nr:ATP-binding protein [Hymenobacter sp. YC55]MDF7812501.1 ATP-binding protein [Hymenobacter sp. YC55]
MANPSVTSSPSSVQASTLTVADFSVIPLLADLPLETLEWLIAHGERRDYAAGQSIQQPGDPAEYMVALLAGGIQFYALRNGNREPIFRVEAGQVSGVLPYSRLQTIKGLSVAVGPTTVFALHRNLFPELERVSPELVQRLVGLMSDRARNEARGQERDEKLRALGKLSAGLAHELNNPAAAIVRAAEALASRLHEAPMQFGDLVCHCPEPAALATLTALAATPPPAGPPLSGLARADREDELIDWLETQEVNDSYSLATGLLDAGLTPAQLEAATAALPALARAPALTWLSTQLTMLRLIQDVQEAGGRISTLVSNVKTYSHMDRAGGFAPLDVHASLESTINMLTYQMREKNIRLVRDYAPELPLVSGQVSSLNQVWTNLLDNAIDALPPGGEITLRTRLEGENIQVFVIDNGPGIPADILPRILDPFFTTKPAGEGTGLGLDIALRIVENHGGKLEVRSEPNHTEFCVWLPVGISE